MNTALEPLPAGSSGAVSASAFVTDGFVGPLHLFTAPECRAIAAHLRCRSLPAPADWPKGRAVTDPFLFELATRPALLAALTALIGPDIVLWGATVVRRRPGQAHPWHTDIESSSADGGFASVWIGIENTTRESSLQLIAGSHRIGRPLQQESFERRVRRGDASPSAALQWARASVESARLVQPDAGDGEALIFDGRLWHGSHNARAAGARTALLLQYAAAGVPIRMPDFSRLEWPFRFHDEPRPPVIVVHGDDRSAMNRIVPPPDLPARERTAWVHQLPMPLAEDRRSGWKPHPVFRGHTPMVDEMACHASVLLPGHSPHPPHTHPEEEVLIVLDGTADVVLAEDAHGTSARIERLEQGSFAYYPPGQHHTIRNSTGDPLTYVMFKWRGVASIRTRPLPTTIVRPRTLVAPDGPQFSRTGPLLEGATAYLERLHLHLSAVGPGGGYDPHADTHDVAILVLSGEVTALGRTIGRGGVVYCPAETMHGLRGGATGASYLVMEFEARPHGLTPRAVLRRRARLLWWKTRGTAARARRLAARVIRAVSDRASRPSR